LWHTKDWISGFVYSVTACSVSALAVAFFRLLHLLSYAHFDILKLTQSSLDEIHLSRLLWKTENHWHLAVQYPRSSLCCLSILVSGSWNLCYVL